jgi:hypothetical protein
MAVRFGIIASVFLRPQVSCDVMLCHWKSCYCCSTWRWRHNDLSKIGTACPKKQCCIPKNLSSLSERLVDSVNAKTKYTVRKWSNFLIVTGQSVFQVCRRNTHTFCYNTFLYTSRQYFAVCSLGTAANSCLTVYLLLANVRVCVARLR